MSRLCKLNSFRLIDFKSYRDASIRLSPLTVMIGANASGKSNLIEGLRLLSWMAEGRPTGDIFRASASGDLLLRGNLPDLAHDEKKDFSLGCSFAITGLEGWTQFHVRFNTTDVGLRVVEESVWPLLGDVPLYAVVKPADAYTRDIQVAYNNFARGGHKPQIKCTDQQLVFTQLRTPARFGKSHEKSQRLIPAVAESIETTLTSVVFLDPVPSAMRGYSHIVERSLDSKGAFLSSVLYDVCEARKQKERVLGFIRELPEQDITDIDFVRTPRNEVMVQLTETFASRKRTRDAPLLSDGTLRVLSIAAALLSAPDGSLVVIEEIDNGVHPSRAGILLDNIFAVSRKRNLNVLLTTHNPALLDALPADAVPKVACCYRDPETGDSEVVHLEDMPFYPELMAQGLLGKLMTQDILDRFLKADRDKEKKKEDALAWLAKMENHG